MNIFAIPPLVTCILLLVVGAYVYFKNRKSKPNIVFGFLCLSLSAWLFGFTGVYLSRNPQTALFWARNGFAGIIFIPIFAYHFIISFLRIKRSYFCIFLYLSSIPALILHRTPYVYRGVAEHFWGYYPVAGKWYIPHLILFVVALSIALLHLLLALKKRDQSPYFRVQIKYLITSFVFGLTGFIDYAIKLGIDVYPWGYISAFMFISVIAFAIVQYNLMDINVFAKNIFSRFAALLFIALAVLFALLLFRSFLSFKTISIFITGCVVGIVILYPLYRYLRDSISLRIRPRPDFQAILKDYTEVELMAQHTSKDLAELVVQRIADTLRPTVCSLMLLDKDSGLYNVIASSGKDEEIKTIAFKQNNHLIMALENAHQTRLIVKDELSKIFTQEQADLIRRDLEILKSQISIPLILQGELFGLLNLGIKSSGELYTPEEMGFIYIFLAQSAFMMQFLDKIQKIHELETKAEKLTGMTNLLVGFEHEINNQMIPTQTYLNLEDESTLSEDMRNFRKSALGGFEAITMILNSVRDYCEAADVRYPSSTDIKESIISSLSKFQDKFASINVKIVTDIPANLPKVETFLCFQYLFPNLFRNCYYGLTQRKTRLLDIKACQTKDSQRPLEIVIKDTGGDLLNRMDRKTLSSGGEDAPERSGIGGINFFIAKLIINDHQGELLVSTNPPPAPDEQAGTIFTIKLPLTQPKT